MFKLIYRSCLAILLFSVLLCGFYPLVVTLLGQAIFPDQALGGMIQVEGRTVGSRLIGQYFSRPEYFHGRPSSAGVAPGSPGGYDGANSSGSNLGPTNRKFAVELKSKIARALEENPGLNKGDVPTDLVTSSGSGLDPHISPEAANVQLPRVARARGVGLEELRKFVLAHVENPQLGLLGESVVNVLVLNLALDRSYPRK